MPMFAPWVHRRVGAGVSECMSMRVSPWRVPGARAPAAVRAAVCRRCFHPAPPVLAKKKDPYDLLGVPKSASASDIKRAYYQQAKQWHPDTNKDPAAKDKFQEIQHAYDILSDESKKAQYDMHGHSDPSQAGFGGSGGFPGGFPGGDFGGFAGFGGFQGGNPFEELLRNFAGDSGDRNEGRYGRDVHVSMRISFMEAVKGVEKVVKYERLVECGDCHGSGVKKGYEKSACRLCGGSGEQVFIRGGFRMSTTCPACGGVGIHVPPGSECNTCGGVTKAEIPQQVTVNIPAGVDNDMHVRVSGKGHEPYIGSGPAGDLVVRLEVLQHPKFRREGTDIFVTASVPLHMAILGGAITVPTIDGDVELVVPPGTQPEERKRMPKRGVVNATSSSAPRGDQYVTLKVMIPTKITPAQRKAFMAAFDLETTEDSHPQPDTHSRASEGSSSKRKDTDGGGFFDHLKKGFGMHKDK
ncbi:hypothetical protein HDU82_006389 [Entophlyctis luteolus]|nr:hypothetical protein HDU82_006389 [Entophlyctis luteolus]